MTDFHVGVPDGITDKDQMPGEYSPPCPPWVGAANLGEICTELMAIDQNEANEYEMDGSGECGDLIAYHLNDARLHVIARRGMLPGDLEAEITRRGLDRWWFFNGPQLPDPDMPKPRGAL